MLLPRQQVTFKAFDFSQRYNADNYATGGGGWVVGGQEINVAMFTTNPHIKLKYSQCLN